MKLIDKIFNRSKLIEEKLIPFGFKLENNIYYYNKFINDSFELQIIIKDNIIDGKLMDLDFNEEYNQINIDNNGDFIGGLRAECEKILLDIRKNCYESQSFLFIQSNRISKLINDKYNVEPEFLWDNAPGYGVFRNPVSEKWFGIIMNINKKKFVKNEDYIIEVLNVNLGEESSNYINIDGIYLPYHMNKKNWISIILDETLNDNKIMELIDISYKISEKKNKKKG